MPPSIITWSVNPPEVCPPPKIKTNSKENSFKARGKPKRSPLIPPPHQECGSIDHNCPQYPFTKLLSHLPFQSYILASSKFLGQLTFLAQIWWSCFRVWNRIAPTIMRRSLALQLSRWNITCSLCGPPHAITLCVPWHSFVFSKERRRLDQTRKSKSSSPIPCLRLLLWEICADGRFGVTYKIVTNCTLN